jgi:hypothetical protein
MTKIALFSVYKIFWTKRNNRKCFSYSESLTNLLQFLLQSYLGTGKCYGVIYSWKYGNLQVKNLDTSKQASFDVVDHDNVTLFNLRGAHEYIYASKSIHISLVSYFIYLFIYLSFYAFIYSFIHTFIYIFIHLNLYMYVYLFQGNCEMYVENMKL